MLRNQWRSQEFGFGVHSSGPKFEAEDRGSSGVRVPGAREPAAVRSAVSSPGGFGVEPPNLKCILDAHKSPEKCLVAANVVSLY